MMFSFNMPKGVISRVDCTPASFARVFLRHR